MNMKEILLLRVNSETLVHSLVEFVNVVFSEIASKPSKPSVQLTVKHTPAKHTLYLETRGDGMYHET